jgi:transposase-like protein
LSKSNNNTAGRSGSVLTQEPPLRQTSPDPHVVPGATVYGTRYTRAFKLQVLKEADGCTESGDIGRMLRRHGITHATLTSFRRQRASGSLSPVRTDSKAAVSNTAQAALQARRVLELERENRGLKRRLTQAEAIIEVQKNVSRLLDISLGEPERRAND